MRPAIHIGPPKTASSSIQESLIPQLGCLYQIKPAWARELSRNKHFLPPSPLPQDIVISDEILGECGAFPPHIIAERLSKVFDDAVVLYVDRNPVELFYSLYRQKLVNEIGYHEVHRASGRTCRPNDPNGFFDFSRKRYSDAGAGFFASINIEAQRTAFKRYFDFQTIDFSLLKDSAPAFVSAFTQACGHEMQLDLPYVNRSTIHALEGAIAKLPLDVRDATKNIYLDLYQAARLSADREDFLRNWRHTQPLQAFVAAFRFG